MAEDKNAMFAQHVEKFGEQLEEMGRQDYMALVAALVEMEGGTFDEERYWEWYNSDFGLLDQSL